MELEFKIGGSTKHAAKSIDINDLPADMRYAADQLLDKWAKDNGVERP